MSAFTIKRAVPRADEWARQNALGIAIARQLQPVRTFNEVALLVGVSPTRVEQIQATALTKVAQRMRVLARPDYE